MRLVGISMVKNEIDIIEYFVRHNLNYLDALLIIDNGSVDGTRELLTNLSRDNKLPLAIYDDPEMGYFQSEKTTKLAHMAGEFFKPDFIFVLDADEFIMSSSREDLEVALSKIPPGTAGRARWQTYVLTPEEGDPPASIFERIRYRRIQERPQYHKVIIPKKFRDDPANIVAQGNHFIKNPKYDIPHQVVPDIKIAHYPVRSLEQLRLKTLLGWLGYLAKKPKDMEGYHWKQIYDLILEDKLNDECLSRISFNYAQEAPLLSGFDSSQLVEEPLISDILLESQHPPDRHELPTIIKSVEKSLFFPSQTQYVPAGNMDIDWLPFKHINEQYLPQSVLVINCNKGEYVQYFKDQGVTHSFGVGATPFDSTVVCDSSSYFYYDDFGKLATENKFDLIVFTERNANLDREKLDKVLHFMAHSSEKRLILCSGMADYRPTSSGEQIAARYWIDSLADLGWKANVFDSLVCRSMATHASLKQGLVVFEKSGAAEVKCDFSVTDLIPSASPELATPQPKTITLSQSSPLYNNTFYNGQKGGSYSSAKIYLERLCAIWRPASVVDLGCGVGTWLTAFAEHGVRRLVGYDGPWLAQDSMSHSDILFKPVDLNNKICSEERFDLAISLEVVEHCRPEASDNFADNLISLADAILFAAAYWQQPGVDHINTRPHSFWAEKFLRNGYILFDFFRPYHWGDNRVEPFYRQNTFLYVKPSHHLYGKLIEGGIQPLANPDFVDCIHPWLFEFQVGRARQLQTKLDEAQQQIKRFFEKGATR